MIVLTDPGFRQEPRQIAAALSERAVPFLLRTSACVDPASAFGEFTAALPGLGERMSRLWRARHESAIEPGAVSNCFFPDLVGRALVRCRVRPGTRNIIVNSSFDAYSAARLPAGAELVVAMQGSARATIWRARRRGVRTVVVANSPDAMTESRLVAEEEHRLGLRSSPTIDRAQRALCARIRRELVEADIVLCGSEFECRDLIENGVEADKVRVVPLGVDTTLFSPSERRPQRNGTARVLYVGGVNARKGVIHLAEAVRLLRRDGTSAELHVYGSVDGAYGALLRSYLDDATLTLHRPRPHAQLVETYRTADVFVLPTLSDGFGLVAYEAMACGVPTIVTDRGGAAVTDGVDACVVPHGDARALSEAIETVLCDESQARRLSQAGVRTARALSWHRYRAEVADLLLDLAPVVAGATPLAGGAGRHLRAGAVQ